MSHSGEAQPESEEGGMTRKPMSKLPVFDAPPRPPEWHSGMVRILIDDNTIRLSGTVTTRDDAEQLIKRVEALKAFLPDAESTEGE